MTAAVLRSAVRNRLIAFNPCDDIRVPRRRKQDTDEAEKYGLGEADLLFANGVGGAHRRTLYRARQWRPSLVRAGLLGSVTRDGARRAAAWSDEDGKRHRVRYATEEASVTQVARRLLQQ